MIINTKVDSFIEEIETICISRNVEYIDAVIHWCERNGFEIEYAAEIIKKNAPLRSKVQIEAENLNFLKKTARLPI